MIWINEKQLEYYIVKLKASIQFAKESVLIISQFFIGKSLASIDINRLAPVEAFIILNDIKVDDKIALGHSHPKRQTIIEKLIKQLVRRFGSVSLLKQKL